MAGPYGIDPIFPTGDASMAGALSGSLGPTGEKDWEDNALARTRRMVNIQKI